MVRSLKNYYPEKYQEFLNGDKYKLRNKMQVEFSKARSECMNTYNCKCAHCGEPAIDVHHIIPIEENGTNEQTNLICLCRACHQQVHRGVYKIDPKTKKIEAMINPMHIIPEDKKLQYIKDFEELTGFTLYKYTGPYYYFKDNIKYCIKAEEIKEIVGYTEEKLIAAEQKAKALAIKQQSIKERKILEQYKQTFKDVGNKGMWHEMCKVIKAWDTLEQIQKDHVFETLHNFFSKYGRTL